MPKISEAKKLKLTIERLRKTVRAQEKTINTLTIKMEKIGMDPVTGLPRYNELTAEEMNRKIDQADRMDLFTTFFYFDLDNLKPINDAHGHSAGNAALHSAAASMKKCLRSHDYLIRVGGDEFLALMTMKKKPSEWQLNDLTKRFRKSVAENPLEFDGKEIPLSVSIGHTVFNNLKSVEGNIKVADASMYHDKQKRKEEKDKKKA